ncbi:MAG: terpene cyclase/mutase family protein [Planctomycetota bacterium]|nr:terpene cyclase/mutase family protein [Planctomycetota bacterium]MDI6788129.1 terpene cyclase/mutase family protein [Planctomycetota bacterium]
MQPDYIQEIEVCDGSLAQRALEQRFDPNLWLQEQLHNAPWWAISLTFHIFLILILASLPSASTVPPPCEIPIIDMKDEEPPKEIERVKEVLEREIQKEEIETKETTEPVIDEKTDNPNDIDKSPITDKGNYDVIGIGGGYGDGRPGGPGSNGGKPPEPAVISGLVWLAKHQNPDGSWGAKTFQNQCKLVPCRGASLAKHQNPDGSWSAKSLDGQGGHPACTGTGDEGFNIGLTGLAMLAFTGAGYTPSSRYTCENIRFGDVVRKAAQYLVNVQLSDGTFGGVKDGKFMYNQSLATYALTDLYGLLMNRPASIPYREPVERAIKYLLSVQNPDKAWRYQPKDGQNDTSVTGWMVMALKAAEHAKIHLPPETFNSIKSFYDDVTDPTYGKVGYTSRGSIAITKDEDPRNIVIQPSLTAIGVMVRIFIDGKTTDPLIKLGVQQVLAALPTWDTTRRGIIDYYYWFYASYCLNQYDGPAGPVWKQWNDKMRDVLLKSQRTENDGCANGSWDPLDRWSNEGSRVYCTATNILTLEVYYRLGIVKLNR